MHILTGEIGKLSLNGEQVGGFKYWTAIIARNPPNTKVVASKFWMLKEVDTNKLEAEFYTQIDDRLKLIHKRDVVISLPEHELDKLIAHSLEMDLGDFNWLF